MNIPRYITAKNDEIAHDVDAHLLGGIPEKDIKSLKILNTIAPDILSDSLEEKRKGYYELTKEISQLTDEIIESEQVRSKSRDMKEKINNYINEYWHTLIKLKK